MAAAGDVLLMLGVAGQDTATTLMSAIAARAADPLADATGPWSRVAAWIRDGYTHAPALMLALALLLALPVLALLGALTRWRRGGEETPVTLWWRQQEASAAGTAVPADGMTWPVDAWVEIDGKPPRLPIRRELMRIGRDDDNEIVLAEPSVHRFHAVIQRTEDAEVVLIDLSGAGGNGISVNGKRVSRARLMDGDEIGIAGARLKFGSRRA